MVLSVSTGTIKLTRIRLKSRSLPFGSSQIAKLILYITAPSKFRESFINTRSSKVSLYNTLPTRVGYIYIYHHSIVLINTAHSPVRNRALLNRSRHANNSPASRPPRKCRLALSAVYLHTPSIRSLDARSREVTSAGSGDACVTHIFPKYKEWRRGGGPLHTVFFSLSVRAAFTRRFRVRGPPEECGDGCHG